MQITPQQGRNELSQIPVWWVVGILAAVVVALPFEGNDYPAQIYHTDFVRELGEVFNLQWFAGHHVAGYGVLLAPVAAVLGIGVTGIVSALVSSWAFDRLVVGLPGRRLAAWWFGVGTLVNLLIGRLTFALGLALGLCALLALRRGHYALALVLTSATMLGSPVAGTFLALAMAAWTLDDLPGRLWRGIGLGAACFGPYLVMLRLFPSGGWFPYPGQSFVIGLGISVLLLVFVPRQYRLIRIAVGLHIVAAVATMTLQTAMGGNINRLSMFFAGPILAAVTPIDRRKLVALVALPLLYWQWSPSFDAVVAAPADRSRTAEYYAPLVSVLDDAADVHGPVRVEIVPTLRHWEVAEVAPEIPIARGWWRQLDIDYNPLFYDGTLDAASYRAWLDREAVTYVAVPRGELDHAGVDEGDLIAGGLDYLALHRVLADWTVYEVVDPQPIVAGPATLVEYGVDDLVIHVEQPGTLHVAVRSSPHWKLTGNAGCLAESDDGFVDITGVEPGMLRLTIDVEFSALWDGGPDGCATPPD
ncbi:MAG: hypothetical protein ACRDZZ_04890 [Ilumatobacteraceae bacterium]